MNRKVKKILQSIILCMLVILLVLLPLTASTCADDPCFSDFSAVWSCDYGDVKLTFTTGGVKSSRWKIPGKMVLDGVETELILYFDRVREVAVAFKANEVDTSVNKWNQDTKSRVFIAQTNGHKKAVTFKIIYDYTGRPGEKSLLNRTFVLNRKNL